MAALGDDSQSVVGEYQLDLSDLDASEAEKVSSFFSSGCGCKLGPKGSSCSSIITRDLAVLCRNNCQQLDDSELDMVVLSQLQALRTHPDQPLPDNQKCDSSTQRHTAWKPFCFFMA